MKKLVWSITGLTIYVYAINILISWGYYSYFGLPSEFVSASLTGNVISYFALFNLATTFVQRLGWSLLLFIILLVIVAFFYFVSFFFQRLIHIVAILFLMWLVLFACFDFGNWVAKNTTHFYAPSADCASTLSGTGFIVPGFINEKAIIVPIDSHYKMTGGFSLRDISQIPCVLQMKETGRIAK